MGALLEQKQGASGAKKKLNCWEFKKCGREPGGLKADERGVCPAATDQGLNNAHRGRNGGRACWVVAGSFCGGKVQGTCAKKLLNCRRCEFMNSVRAEEEPTLMGFSQTRHGMERSIKKMADGKNSFSSGLGARELC
jgi:hypothetical protein